MTNMLIISEITKLQPNFRTNVELNRSYSIQNVCAALFNRHLNVHI